MRKEDFVLRATCAKTGESCQQRQYPIRSENGLPKLGVELERVHRSPSQETAGNQRCFPRYWEGAMTLLEVAADSRFVGAGYWNDRL